MQTETAMAASDVWHLRSVDWLAELGSDQLEKLRAASRSRDYAVGETVFAPEDRPHSLYLLEAGLVRIFRLSESGAETTFGYVAPGEVFGEMAAIGVYPRQSFAVAVRRSRIWRIPQELFRDVLHQNPGIAVEVTRQVGERLKRIENRVESLVFRDARSRLALMLLELAADFGEPDGAGVALTMELTQAELATLVGSTRQTVNACLREFEAQGLTERRGRRLVLPRPDALRKAAGSPAAPSSGTQ
jgi:CRP/FNR family transcriptional regulator, cyclic AMP receptor protein